MRVGFLALALALLAGVVYWESRTGSGQATTATAAPMVAPVFPPPLPEMKPALPQDTKAAVVAKPIRVDVARRTQLERELWQSNDWTDFVRENLPLAQAGEAEAQVQIGIVLHFCNESAKESAAESAAKANGKAVDADSAATARFFAQRCSGLDQLPRDELGTARQWLQLAARQGNGLALFQLAADTDGGDSLDQRLTDLHGALASSDPSMINLLVLSASARPGADASAAGLDPAAEWAAEALTKCAVGYDCSASGPIYDALPCRRKGCLHADGVERYYELSLSRQQFAEAQAYSQRLAANLGSGRYDWPEAQILEKQLLDSANGDDANAAQSNP